LATACSLSRSTRTCCSRCMRVAGSVYKRVSVWPRLPLPVMMCALSHIDNETCNQLAAGGIGAGQGVPQVTAALLPILQAGGV
jgi:hypothetical protein